MTNHLTKKDYELIAGVFKQEIDFCEAEGYESAGHIRTVAMAMATRLSVENPKFNRQKFLAACGVTE